MQFLQTTFGPLVLIFTVSNLAAMGLQVRMPEVMVALRNKTAVALIFVWGWLLGPAVGYLITTVTVCDTYLPGHVHISPEVIPPALAVAEEGGHGGRALLAAAHVEAAYRGRRLLILDTRTGDAGERLYESMGYTRAGEIPGFTIEPDGARHGTTIFYHVLR